MYPYSAIHAMAMGGYGVWVSQFNPITITAATTTLLSGTKLRSK